MTPSIDQFEILTREQEVEFFKSEKFDNDDLLRSFPARHTQDFIDLSASERSNILKVTNDLYLVRGGGVGPRSCSECAMGEHAECFRSFRNVNHEMPCTGPQMNPSEVGYYLARIKPVSLPTNGKKNKKEYVPDTAANFDFSNENWKSVRSMIGM